ncbi:MAG: hypothetical protein KF791_11335 [Verrucomicrobiae bacterium]|nr:hypothetical protein [Verrucomicrobiae bacterium]
MVAGSLNVEVPVPDRTTFIRDSQVDASSSLENSMRFVVPGGPESVIQVSDDA